MGGKGSGGARPNSGPKRRSDKAAFVAGAGPAPASTGAASPAGGPLACPVSLPPADALVWAELAPLAHGRGTLTVDMAPAFTLLCAQVAAERALRLSPLHAWGPDHRGVVRLVELGMARFRIQPDGKPAEAPAKPMDPFAQFDQGPQLVAKRA